MRSVASKTCMVRSGVKSHRLPQVQPGALNGPSVALLENVGLKGEPQLTSFLRSDVDFLKFWTEHSSWFLGLL